VIATCAALLITSEIQRGTGERDQPLTKCIVKLQLIYKHTVRKFSKYRYATKIKFKILFKIISLIFLSQMALFSPQAKILRIFFSAIGEKNYIIFSITIRISHHKYLFHKARW